MLMTMLKTKVNKSVIIFLRVWKKLWLGKSIVNKESKNTRDKYEDDTVSGNERDKDWNCYVFLQILISRYGDHRSCDSISDVLLSTLFGRWSSRLMFLLVIGLFYPARYLILAHEAEKIPFFSSNDSSERYWNWTNPWQIQRHFVRNSREMESNVSKTFHTSLLALMWFGKMGCSKHFPDLTAYVLFQPR